MFHTYYIKTDAGNNVIQISKTKQSGDSWFPVSVDKQHVYNFEHDYIHYSYDPSINKLLTPDGVDTITGIPNYAQSPMPSGGGSGGNSSDVTNINNKITNLQNRLNSMKLNGIKIKDIENN